MDTGACLKNPPHPSKDAFPHQLPQDLPKPPGDTLATVEKQKQSGPSLSNNMAGANRFRLPTRKNPLRASKEERKRKTLNEPMRSDVARPTK